MPAHQRVDGLAETSAPFGRPVVHPGAASFAVDQARVAQLFQVVRHGRLRDADVLDVAHAQRIVHRGDADEQAQPDWVGDRFEERGGVLGVRSAEARGLAGDAAVGFDTGRRVRHDSILTNVEATRQAYCIDSYRFSGGCGMADQADIREQVRQRYAESARSVTGGGCCESTVYDGNVTDDGTIVFGSGLYDSALANEAGAAVEASLGCGVPTAVADLHEGETVLDLGSGAGGDVLISARRVGSAGRVIGLDMTDEMLDLARRNATDAGASNVEFVKGYLEDIPLPDASVDVVISNCVINLAADKNIVLAEAARVTKRGGRFAVSDVIASENMDDVTRADMAAFTGCIAGALTEAQYRQALDRAGWSEVEVRYTHAVHDYAQAAIVRAVRS